ncbi:MAG: calcium-binding protein, partial [Pseudolabrys sp.]
MFVGPVGNPAPQPNPTTVSSVETSGAGIDGGGNGDLNAGHVVTLTVAMSEVVTVAGGIPTLSLNNGGTASYSGGSGSNTLTFSYTVGAGQDTSDLAVTSFNLNGATVSDPAGNDAIVAGAVSNPSGILQIDTTAPTVPSISSITLGGSGGNHWVFTGTAEANSSIAVFDGNTQLTTVAASGLGAWNYTTTGAVTNASIHNFTATASDAAGNTSAFLASWIEGTAGNDTFSFNSEGQLIAPALINGNGGADTIAMTAPVTLNSGDFANVSAVQSLQLTGANVVTLGADAVTAGIVNVITGNGATSIADPNSGTLTTINATALLDNTALSLSGAAGFTVTGLQGDLTATGVSGALNVTTVAVASGLSIATGSGSNTITATALTTGQTLTLTGSSAATVTLNAGASSGNLAAGTDTGNLTVTGGTGANTITVGNGTNSITGGGGADVLTGGTGSDTFNFSSAANLGAATTIAGGAGNDTIQMTAAATLTDANLLHAASIETLGLTGASTITLGANAASAGIVNVVTGSGATSITDSNGVTLSVDATALANNTALTLVGSSAEVVTGLIGDIAAGTLTGALTVTTGDATDNTIAITTGSAATAITDSFNTDTVTVTATALAQNTALTFAGSAAEVVTGLVGDIAAGTLTGALTVTTGNAAD